jgi:hypothetical protein
MRLTLRLGVGRIDGEGDDIVGPFTFSGEYDQRGHVRMTKQYLGKHQLLYEGAYDGEGTIFGRWSYLWATGPFALALETAEDHDLEAVAIVPVKTGAPPGR